MIKIRRIIFAKEIAEGERLPRFYGVAYPNQMYSGVVCYPIPVNIVVRWFRRLFNWARDYKMDKRELELQKAWRDFRNIQKWVERDSFQKGFDSCQTQWMGAMKRMGTNIKDRKVRSFNEEMVRVMKRGCKRGK